MVAIFKLTNNNTDFKILLMLLLQVMIVAIFNPINPIMDSYLLIYFLQPLMIITRNDELFLTYYEKILAKISSSFFLKFDTLDTKSPGRWFITGSIWGGGGLKYSAENNFFLAELLLG